jgi:hypothetical protein
MVFVGAPSTIDLRKSLFDPFKLLVGQFVATTSGHGKDQNRSTCDSVASYRLFVRQCLVNRQGDILLNDEPVALSGLADAAREKIRKDAVRAVIIPDADAPPETIRSVEAQLRTLSLQKVYRQDSDS